MIVVYFYSEMLQIKSVVLNREPETLHAVAYQGE